MRGKIGPLLALYFHGFEFPNVLSIEFPILLFIERKWAMDLSDLFLCEREGERKNGRESK